MADMDNAPLDLSGLSDDQRKAFALSQKEQFAPPPPPVPDAPAADPWASVPAAHDRPMVSMTRDQPPPQMGQPPPPQAVSRAGGGAPTDWDKYGAHATGADIAHPGLDAAQANAQQIAGREGDVATQGAAVQAANLGVRNQKMDQVDAHDAALDAPQKEAEDKAMNVYRARSEDAANQKLDHEHYARSQSTGGKILSQVAVAFGALGQAFGGHNYAIDNINKHIENDVEDQKSAIDAKRAGAANAKDTYSMLRQHGMDDKAAMAGHRAVLFNKAARDGELFAAQQKTPEDQLKGQEFVNKLRGEAAKNELEVQQGSRRAGMQARAQAAAAQASANSAQAAAAYKHQQDALENRRKDIALGLTAEKQHFDMDKSAKGEGKTEPAIQAVLNAEQGTGSTALIDGVLANPFRGSAFSSDKSADMANNGFNTAVDSVAHKIAGIRGREEQAHAMAHLHIEPSDSTEMIAQKQAMFKQIYGSLQMGGTPNQDNNDDGNDSP